MKICIPAEDNKGLTGSVSGHFGSAPYFCLYETETKEAEFIKNGGEEHEHGTCVPVGLLAPYNISAVLCSGMGAGAASKLNSAGIKVYKGAAKDIEGFIEAFNEGKTAELNIQDCCHGH